MDEDEGEQQEKDELHATIVKLKEQIRSAQILEFELSQAKLPKPIRFGQLSFPPQPQSTMNEAKRARFCRAGEVAKHELFKFLGGVRVSDYEEDLERFVFEINVLLDGGCFAKPSYVIVNRTEDGAFDVVQHRLPHVQIMKQVLIDHPPNSNEELVKFLQRIRDCCDAFHQKTVQIAELRAKCNKMKSNIFHNLALTYVQIKMTYFTGNKPVSVTLQLFYEHHRSYPHRYNVVATDVHHPGAQTETYVPFLGLSLATAFELCWLKEESSESQLEASETEPNARQHVSQSKSSSGKRAAKKSTSFGDDYQFSDTSDDENVSRKRRQSNASESEDDPRRRPKLKVGRQPRAAASRELERSDSEISASDAESDAHSEEDVQNRQTTSRSKASGVKTGRGGKRVESTSKKPQKSKVQRTTVATKTKSPVATIFKRAATNARDAKSKKASESASV